MTTPSSSSAATSQIVTLPPIPELFDPNFLDALIPETVPQNATNAESQVQEVASNAMMDALRSVAHHTLTTNAAPAFSSTLSDTLDAFTFLSSGSSPSSFNQSLQSAWEEDADLTLRVIWNMRSIHDGKSDKELFYRAFGWLFKNHPRTAITNLHCLVDPVCLISKKKGQKKYAPHGYWKDLLNILALATVGELNPETLPDPRSNFLHKYCARGSRPAFKDNQEQEEWSRKQRIKLSRQAHDHLVQMLQDKHYRALYIAVARLFATQLARDCEVMDKIAALPDDANKKDRMALMHSLGLAIKWAPTPGGSHDRVTNISSAICLLLSKSQGFYLISQSDSNSVAESLETSTMHRLRHTYQKHVLTRGRWYACVPEPLMASNRWSDLDYSRIPSVCMSNNKAKFIMHDQERFAEYMEDVKLGKRQVSGATLLPHLLAMDGYQLYEAKTRARSLRLYESAEIQMKVVDAQWATLLARLRETGLLDNCIAVCDVSGSMGSFYSHNMHASRSRKMHAFNVDPIWPALSLSLLVARLAKPPFNDSFITFSASPQLVTLDPESRHVPLGETIQRMSKVDWTMNTNFNAVFLELILPLAIKHAIPKDEMIRRIFVFSDMQFDSANNTDYSDRAADWKTNHDIVAEAYARAGYDVPEIVYWNLSRFGGLSTTPVTGEREGVALLSGYSPSLLKLFVNVDDAEEDSEKEEKWEVLQGQSDREELTPVNIMMRALQKKCYDGLLVVD